MKILLLHKVNILLADDDIDDCMFFQEALDELQLQTKLTTVHDGERLLQRLTNLPCLPDRQAAGRHGNSDQLFDVLFLDLNMPRKNGFACLTEIKSNPKLKALPVIILSTSFDHKIADLLYKNGAQHYICKPADFSQLKKVIGQALALVAIENNQQPSQSKFLLTNLKSILF